MHRLGAQRWRWRVGQRGGGTMNVYARFVVFFFQAEDGIRDLYVTGVQTCALPIFSGARALAGVKVAVTVSYAGVTATFTPASALAPLTTYTATVTTGARNLAAIALATGFSWSFTTGVTPDTTRPIVSATVPANAATAVAINQTINAAFSKAMDPL